MPGGPNASIMLGNRKLIVDEFCEVKEFTRDFQDGDFWSFAEHEICAGAVYIISRQQFAENIVKIKQLAQDQIILPVLGNPAEGSETMFKQAQALGILELVQQGKIIIISGGDLPEEIPHLFYENFLPKLLDYTENLQAIAQYKKNWSTDRPYKFLFLNGRGRHHRRQLLASLQPLLDVAIWSNLDSAAGAIKLLDPVHEFEFYRHNLDIDLSGFVKYSLFDNNWGEIYLNAQPYTDSYFSLVTETVFDYPHSFRTEKIWKPIAIGHPFVVASNAGYYRDLHDLGFKTFGNLIDESFDQETDNAKRLSRLVHQIEWLCQQDLAKFVQESYNVCKYNQSLLAELGPKIRAEFPQKLLNFIK